MGPSTKMVQTKNYKIGICYITVKTLRSISIDWLVRVQQHVYSWTVAILSMRWHYKNPIRRVGLVQNGNHNHLLER